MMRRAINAILLGLFLVLIWAAERPQKNLAERVDGGPLGRIE